MVGLQDRVAHLPSELSGGEQQRVYVQAHFLPFDTIEPLLEPWPMIRKFYCWVHFNNNDEEWLMYIYVDEPTGDLDTFNTVEIMDLLLKINLERKTTCIMVCFAFT